MGGLEAQRCAKFLLRGRDRLLDSALDLLAGERGRRRAEDEGDGYGFLVFVERLAPIGGDEFQIFQIGKFQGADETVDLRVGDVFGDDEREVAADGGEAGELMELGDVLGEFEEGFQLDFGGDDLVAEGKLIGDCA